MKRYRYFLSLLIILNFSSCVSNDSKSAVYILWEGDMKPSIRDFLLETPTTKSTLNEMLIGEPEAAMVSGKCIDDFWREVLRYGNDDRMPPQKGWKFIRYENSIIVSECSVGEDVIHEFVESVSMLPRECEGLEKLNDWLLSVQVIKS